MASLRIYRDAPNSDGYAKIKIQVSHQGERITFSTTISILEKHWDEEQRRVKTSHPFAMDLNNDLAEIRKGVAALLHLHRKNFSLDRLRVPIKKILEKERPKQMNFFDWLEKFIEESKTAKRPNTVKKFQTLKTVLKEFGGTFDTDITWITGFVDWLINEKDLLDNTVEKYVSNLRTFLTWADERGLSPHPDYKKLKWKRHNIEPIFLTEEELLRVYNLEGLLPYQERVRDVFCFACWTGLRYSDVAGLTEANIKNGKIYLNQIKVSEPLKIPLNQYSRAILEKYDYKLPVIGNYKTNEYLKEVGEKAKLNSMEKRVQFKGGQRIETTFKKWQILSFHDARRTFIILLLIKGTPIRIIMEMTGHKDFKSFQKYVRIAEDVTTDAMNKAWG
jgi:integrase